MSLLLDTDVCSAVMTGRVVRARQRFQTALRGGERIFASSVTSYELWYGVQRSRSRERHSQAVALFLSQIGLIPFDEADAQEAALVRATLEAAGVPIGAYDVLIAGQARRRGFTLVTGNMREFARVPGLDLEDWFA